MRSAISSCAALFAISFLTAHEVAAATATQLYSIGSPTNEQQYMLELVNRARADGEAEAARLGLTGGLQEGPPNINGQAWTIQRTIQPLSWNPLLAMAAQNHSKALNDGDQFFSGQSPHTFGGMTPAQRIAATGYRAAQYSGPTTASGSYPGEENVSEEVSYGSGPYTGARFANAVRTAHEGLFTDNGMGGGNAVPGRGHRNTIMLGFFRELGVGATAGADNYSGQNYDSFYLIENFGTQSGATPFITGVVFNDANGNGFYDPGEGVGGVRVDVSGSTYYAITSSSGGYSVPVAGDGAYTVSFSGGPLPNAQRSATITNKLNTKVDYMTSNPPPAVRLANISTRVLVQTGDNALIGGFIVTGSQPKKLMLRAIGPTLPFPNPLADPTLELVDGNGVSLESNNDWQDSPNKQAIINSGIAPGSAAESAIVRTVPPGAYTASVRGANNGTGVALVEVYDLDGSTDSKLANISTRGRVETGENVMIGGTILLGSGPQKVIVRALGPSLSVPGKLADPTLELRDGNGTLVAQNDNWRSSQPAEIAATQIPPPDDAEAAIVQVLQPAPYTAVVRGANGSTGVALVEVYALTR